ncbi:hypothetical protein [Mesorhizobium sp. M9A.F.Ca.ET.002.03.1.2]|uniref:hypothetical protein n=1 Tax=Mesorhizobium sp. M9A.F.Ca.ET.002.03.1.2 TaxID=2493668 RepID=UPI0016795E99|nr:hypothetical protein [Mesorhizobium sp. M9A.F.Ca.ET.002.03.1.2]
MVPDDHSRPGGPNTYYAHGLGIAMYDLFAGGGFLAGDVEFYRTSNECQPADIHPGV